jgi:hypothetical protein
VALNFLEIQGQFFALSTKNLPIQTNTMHINARKLVDRDCALILIGYQISCLGGLPSLGAGSRMFKSTQKKIE